MKKRLYFSRLQLFVVCLLLITIAAQAQDVIYFDNGDAAADVRLKGVTADKLIVQSNTSTKESSFSRSKILLAFRKNGNYLLISELASDLTQAKQQVNDFLSSPPRSSEYDFLIKAAPLSVIPGQITYESDEIVNYKTTGGNAASISKNELVAIIHKDGHHLLIAQPGDAAPLLAEVRPDLANGGKAVEPPKPEPVQPKVDAAVAVAKPEERPPVRSTLPDTAPSSTRTLNEEEKESYRQKSLQKVDEFTSYISIITDKDNSSSEKDLAIEQALKLFVDERQDVEVTSLKRAGSRKIPIREYLLRLKLLPYKFTKIEWVETKFIRDLTLENDGSYYGTVAGQQTFTGYDSNGKPLYSDVTDKNVRVKLAPYQKIIDAKMELKWRVLLGSIRVGDD